MVREIMEYGQGDNGIWFDRYLNMVRYIIEYGQIDN